VFCAFSRFLLVSERFNGDGCRLVFCAFLDCFLFQGVDPRSFLFLVPETIDKIPKLKRLMGARQSAQSHPQTIQRRLRSNSAVDTASSSSSAVVAVPRRYTTRSITAAQSSQTADANSSTDSDGSGADGTGQPVALVSDDGEGVEREEESLRLASNEQRVEHFPPPSPRSDERSEDGLDWAEHLFMNE